MTRTYEFKAHGPRRSPSSPKWNSS
jgi:hypothetical protein